MSQIDIFGNPLPGNTEISIKQGLNIIENGEFIFYANYFTPSGE